MDKCKKCKGSRMVEGLPSGDPGHFCRLCGAEYRAPAAPAIKIEWEDIQFEAATSWAYQYTKCGRGWVGAGPGTKVRCAWSQTSLRGGAFPYAPQQFDDGASARALVEAELAKLKP